MDIKTNTDVPTVSHGVGGLYEGNVKGGPGRIAPEGRSNGAVTCRTVVNDVAQPSSQYSPTGPSRPDPPRGNAPWDLLMGWVW